MNFFSTEKNHGGSMKKSIGMYVILIILAFAVNVFAMGGGEQQPADPQQPGVQERAWEDDQVVQTFTGTVDQIGDDYVLIVNGMAYELDVDEQMVEGMIGQQVEVQGRLEEQTIQAEAVHPAGQMNGPLGTQPGEQRFPDEQQQPGWGQQPGEQQQPGTQQQQPGYGQQPGTQQQ
jgi:hypothetical protein